MKKTFKIKDSVNQLLDRYILMKRSTKRLIFWLIVAMIFSVGFNKIYKPKQTTMFRLEQQSKSLDNQMLKSKSELPDVSTERRLLISDKNSLAALDKQLVALERQLPQQDSLPNLLGRLVKQSDGYDLDFKLIKPIDEEGDDTYNRLNIEMRFLSDFTSVVNYLRRLENIFEFLTTDSILVKNIEEDDVEGLQVTMYLSTLLADQSFENKPLSKMNLISNSADIIPTRNPYQPIGMKKVKEEEEQKIYVLSGVILNGNKPTAIIDNDIYTLNDMIDDSKIKKISSEGVVLIRNEKEHFLKIEDAQTNTEDNK